MGFPTIFLKYVWTIITLSTSRVFTSSPHSLFPFFCALIYCVAATFVDHILASFTVICCVAPACFVYLNPIPDDTCAGPQLQLGPHAVTANSILFGSLQRFVLCVFMMLCCSSCCCCCCCFCSCWWCCCCLCCNCHLASPVILCVCVCAFNAIYVKCFTRAVWLLPQKRSFMFVKVTKPVPPI